MASTIKNKVSQVAGRASGAGIDEETKQEAEKYRLLVTAGPSYDQSKHKTVFVNSDTPTVIDNAYLTAKIKVRIRGYQGLPSSSPSTSPYFDDPIHEKDQYSLAFSFVPKVDIPSINTVWGNDFDHPVRDRLPPGFNTAFKIVKEFIDPGLQCDAYADEPWLYGPSLSCWFAFRIGDNVPRGKDFPAPSEQEVMTDGADGSGAAVRQKHGIPDNNEKRRKFFLDAKHREDFVFEKGRCYQADFYNPYIDFGNFALKLPGFSINVIKYVDQKSHCLRYVFKNKGTGDIYFNINFHLLWGDKLETEIAKERKAKVGDPYMNGHDGADDDHGQVEENNNEQLHDLEGPAQAGAEEDTAAQSRVNTSTNPTKEQPNGSQGGHGDQVSEISRLLQETSTVDKRGSDLHYFKES